MSGDNVSMTWEHWESIEVRENGKVRIDTLKDGAVVARSEEFDERDVFGVLADVWNPVMILRDRPKCSASERQAYKQAARKPYELLNR